MCDVRTMHRHLFHLQWQRMQFGNLIETIQEGDLVCCLLFRLLCVVYSSYVTYLLSYRQDKRMDELNLFID